MPDAPGLELIAHEINTRHDGAIVGTTYDRAQPVLLTTPEHIREVLRWLKDQPGQRYDFLSSLHAADYLPAQPRFAVHYELINRDRVERIRVKAMLEDAPPAGGDDMSPAPVSAGDISETGPAGQGPSSLDPSLPSIDSCVELFPTAEAQEREAFDFFGIDFRGHPNLTRILLPDDYVGWPQRRDFPVGGEPVTFTYNEQMYG